uniref:Uncharacterized protein n=1 Tax=Anguilla anguilla TaxID=7936 RepID=A0A0E9TFE6_ANGAN
MGMIRYGRSQETWNREDGSNDRATGGHLITVPEISKLHLSHATWKER